MYSTVKEYKGPKSICACGHTGNGPDSDHGNPKGEWGELAPGHGCCSVPGCTCTQFTWVGWTPEFEAFLKQKQR